MNEISLNITGMYIELINPLIYKKGSISTLFLLSNLRIFIMNISTKAYYE